MAELRYQRCTDYVKRKKEFYIGLIERGLRDFYYNPENDGKDPFLYIRIFQFDPEKMKRKRDKFHEIQSGRVKSDPLTVKRTMIKRSVANYKYKRKDNQWAGDEYESKKIQSETKYHEEVEIKYDDEVHCYIQVDSRLPMETAMVITSEKKCLTEKDMIIIPDEKSIYENMIGKAVISTTDHFQSDSFDVSRALTMISESIPIKVDYNPMAVTTEDVKDRPITNMIKIKTISEEIEVESGCTCSHKFRSIMSCNHTNETIIEFVMLNNAFSQLVNRITPDIRIKVLNILEVISKILGLRYTHKGLVKTNI